MRTYHEKLEESRRVRDSFLCVGLDPDPGHEALSGLRPSEVMDWLTGIIGATSPFAAVYKPQSAFFEAYGREGWDMLARVREAIPEDIPVILDVKRGDIGSTSAAYARAVFEQQGFDAITVSPYLGGDGLAPFFAWSDRGVYVLARTSNPGAADFQEAVINGRALYLEVAARVAEWAPANGGLVVGATAPAEIAAVREVAPRAELLIPGVGAQGGDLEAAVAGAGDRFVINVSRSILFAAPGAGSATAAGLAARALSEQIRQARGRSAETAAR